MTHEPTRTTPPDDSATRTASEPPTATADRTNTFAPAGAIPTAHAIPGFELLGEIARGGMGVVYRARQLRLNREVALKLVLHADPKSLIRFLAEAEAVAAVRHPHVVQVFDSGQHDGQPYLAMELCPNGTLTAKLAAGKLPPRAAAELLARIADGVGAAHAAGIVHRDLKPGNVLFDADDRPKVADFGLAKRGSGSDLTNTQAIMGTPAYMSPEQASGSSKFVGPPADVWALGVILYQSLTGRRPFDGDSPLEVIDRVRSADPPSVRSVSREVPRELEAVVRKCLAKEPTERYATATELAADLRNWLEGRPLMAKPAGAAEAAVKWVRRNRVLAGVYALATAVLMLGAFGVVLAGLWRVAEKARDEAAAQKVIADTARGDAETARDKEVAARGEAEKQKAAADRQRDKFERFEYGWKMQTAHRHWQEFNFQATLAMLDDTRPELRGWEWQYLKRLCDNSTLAFRGHGRVVEIARWSPDGKRVVTVGGGKVQVWDAGRGELVRSFDVNPTLSFKCVAGWSADGSQFVVVECNGKVRVWSTTDWAERVVTPGVRADQIHNRFAMAPNGDPDAYPLASFDPTATRLLVAGTDGAVAVVIDISSGKVTAKCGTPAQSEQWYSPEWSPKGDYILAYESKKGLVCWNAATGEEVPVPKELDGPFRYGRWSPDGKRVVISGAKKSEVWDAVAGRKLFEAETVGAATWSADGKRLITTSTTDRKLRMWDVDGAKEVFVLDEGQFFSYRVGFSPDGSKFVTVSGDGKKVRVCESQTGAETHALRGHTSIVRTAEWSPDGRRVLTSCSDGTARVWDLVAVSLEPDVSGERVLENAMSKQLDWFIRPTSADTCEVWDAKAGVLRLRLNGSVSQVIGVQRQPQGDGLLVSFRSLQGMQVRLYAANAERPLRVFPGQYLHWHFPGWDPTGRYILTIATDDQSASVWDATSDKPLLKAEWPAGFKLAYPPMKVEWRQEAGRLVISQGDKPTKEWRTDTWAEVPHVAGRHSPGGKRVVTIGKGRGTKSSLLDGLTGQVIRVFDEPVSVCWWSPNGKWCLIRGDNASAHMRTADTGDVLFELGTDTGAVNHCEWAPNGKFIMTAATDGSVRVWDATTGAVTHVVPGLAPRLWHDRSAWSPDGKGLLLVYDLEHDPMNIPLQAVVVRLHEKGKHFRLPGGHVMSTTTAEWSPDGKRILTAGMDFTTRVWDSESGAELLVLKTTSRHAYSTWSPDGTRIISFNQKEFLTNERLGTLKVYDTTPKAPAKE